MTSKTLKSAIWLTLVAGAVALAAGGVAYGKGRPTNPGGGGGGGKPPSEATNSLSVPAILAGGAGAFTSLVCGDRTDTDTGNDDWPAINPPNKAPVSYPAACAPTNDGEVCVDAGNYFVQKVDAWQAPCMKVTSANATGAWGDNLAGDAKLSVGSPIRVELVLWDDVGFANSEAGYHVIKLQPAELDRLSDYGHLADSSNLPVEHYVGNEYFEDPDVNGEFVGFFRAIVHDPAATLTIAPADEDGNVVGDPVFDGLAGGEINATGKIVYGYNLRVTTAGYYLITYHVPNVTLSGCDAGTCTNSDAKLLIEVGGGGGGGGGKGGGKPPGAGEGE